MKTSNKKIFLSSLTLAAALVCASPLWAAATQVVFVDGTVDYKKGGGAFKPLDFGNVLNTGDTVRTGKDGSATLSQNGVDITVNGGTVFSIQEKEQGGKKQDVLAVTLGSIKMKYGKLTGQEPLLRTASAVAGVRGTELTMFAGSEGSSLIVVDSGSVEVSAEGKSVLLAPNEGVEVKPGQAPGDKFVVQRNQIDYSKWDGDKLTNLLADPAASMDALLEQLSSYAKDVSQNHDDFVSFRKKLDEERAKAVALVDTDGKDASQKYLNDIVNPLAVQTSNLNLNFRYFALAALSMRRYVVGHLYTQLKAAYIQNDQDPAYQAFLAKYQAFLTNFESAIVPQLVDNDI